MLSKKYLNYEGFNCKCQQESDDLFPNFESFICNCSSSSFITNNIKIVFFFILIIILFLIFYLFLYKT